MLYPAHALTGCDSINAHSELSKEKGLIVLQWSNEQCASDQLGQLGEEPKLSNSPSEARDIFISGVYSTAKGAGRKVNDVRYWMFY